MQTEKLTPYTFVATYKHIKYGLRTGARYRGMENAGGETIGAPVLIYDPMYGPEDPVLKHMVPFRYNETVVVAHDKPEDIEKYGRFQSIPNPSLRAIALIDTALALAVLALAGILIVALA